MIHGVGTSPQLHIIGGLVEHTFGSIYALAFEIMISVRERIRNSSECPQLGRNITKYMDH